MVSNDYDALRERLAAIEHQRWGDWQRWMHAQGFRLLTGELVLPRSLVERWDRQIATPYEQLSEAEKRSDQEQVDRYWPLILEALEARQEEEAEAVKLLRWLVEVIPGWGAESRQAFEESIAVAGAEAYLSRRNEASHAG